MASTRRELLYQIAAATAGAATPVSAQARARQHPPHKTGADASRPGTRKVFNDREFKTLQVLSNWIIPPDEKSKGGIEAGAAEFIDVMAAAEPKLAAAFTGGVAWLDHQMNTRHGKTFVDCTRPQQQEMLDQIAYRKKAPVEFAPGAAFFALMRAWTVDAFYSSQIGIADLGYVGNTALSEFNGCPEEVVKQILEKSPL